MGPYYIPCYIYIETFTGGLTTIGEWKKYWGRAWILEHTERISGLGLAAKSNKSTSSHFFIVLYVYFDVDIMNSFLVVDVVDVVDRYSTLYPCSKPTA